ncbi:MAG: ATP-binding protein [Planctomycetes bacterium]|nr:ATP-binding protein [Planctomycetota bacterium]
MKLNKLRYSQFGRSRRAWKIINCSFGDINLIVGKNASGKTKTLNVIKGLAGLLSKKQKLRYLDGHYDVEFLDGQEKTKYVLRYKRREVVEERLTIGREKLIDRGKNGVGKIFAEKLGKTGKMIDFQTSSDEIAVLGRRDSIQHSYLECLCKWGESLLRYDFGTDLGKNQLVILTEDGPKQELDLKDANRAVSIFLDGKKKFPKTFERQIKADMARIGYALTSIKTGTPTGLVFVDAPTQPIGVSVREKGLPSTTDQHDMSQGMFRALSVIIQLNYALLRGDPSCILIDDIGEGLDFERSSSLVQLLIEKAKESSVQLIMTTNDRFTMNNVPLEYWIILERKPGKCIHHNYRNTKKLFDEFELTGLSNFDLFSSNHYLKK